MQRDGTRNPIADTGEQIGSSSRPARVFQKKSQSPTETDRLLAPSYGYRCRQGIGTTCVLSRYDNKGLNLRSSAERHCDQRRLYCRPDDDEPGQSSCVPQHQVRGPELSSKEVVFEQRLRPTPDNSCQDDKNLVMRVREASSMVISSIEEAPYARSHISSH